MWWIKENSGIDVNINSLFDVQVTYRKYLLNCRPLISFFPSYNRSSVSTNTRDNS